jgi:hypothetical protein
MLNFRRMIALFINPVFAERDNLYRAYNYT